MINKYIYWFFLIIKTKKNGRNDYSEILMKRISIERILIERISKEEI